MPTLVAAAVACSVVLIGLNAGVYDGRLMAVAVVIGLSVNAALDLWRVWQQRVPVAAQTTQARQPLSSPAP